MRRVLKGRAPKSNDSITTQMNSSDSVYTQAPMMKSREQRMSDFDTELNARMDTLNQMDQRVRSTGEDVENLRPTMTIPRNAPSPEVLPASSSGGGAPPMVIGGAPPVLAGSGVPAVRGGGPPVVSGGIPGSGGGRGSGGGGSGGGGGGSSPLTSEAAQESAKEGWSTRKKLAVGGGIAVGAIGMGVSYNAGKVIERNRSGGYY